MARTIEPRAPAGAPPPPAAGPVAPTRDPVPGVIKRNTVLLAAAQAFVGIGNQMIPTLGALMVVRLLGTATLAGLATAILGFSRFVVAYPIGWVADTYGRRWALLIGQNLSLVGALGISAALFLGSFPVFLVGILLFGLGVGAGQQLRLAAADLYPPTRRAEGLGYVLTGSLVGALGGPVLIAVAQALGPGLGLDATTLTWLLVPTVLIPSMGLVLLVRPDPREIATNLRRYYPNARLEAPGRQAAPPASGFRAWIGHFPLRVAFISNFAAQGVMTLMMAMTPLALAHHGHELPMISLAVSLHVVGMFGLSLPIGRLTDRLGRKRVMVFGCWVVALGALLVVLTGEYWLMTLGIALVGVGWCCVNVAASALIADLTRPAERGRAIGTSDTLSGIGAVTLPLAGGPLVEWYGLPVLAVMAAGIMLIPLLMLIRLPEADRHRASETQSR